MTSLINSVCLEYYFNVESACSQPFVTYPPFFGGY